MSSLTRQLYHFATDFDRVLLQLLALTLRTVCLNTEWAIGIWQSWLKYLNCWWKAVKILISYSWIFNAQLNIHLKKWTLKFKLLYLRNSISYFNKIYRICCVNTRIQSLKVWLKSVLPWLKYYIFPRGLFFIGAPCRSRRWTYLYMKASVYGQLANMPTHTLRRQIQTFVG